MKAQLLFVALLVASMAGCQGAPTSPSGFTAAPSTNQTPAAAVSTFVGMTAQGTRFDFTVEGNRITGVNFNVNFPNVSCSGGFIGGAGGPLLGVITDGRILASWASGGSGLQWSMEGNLLTATTAEGTLTVNFTPTLPQAPPCNAASVSVGWTAEKTPVDR